MPYRAVPDFRAGCGRQAHIPVAKQILGRGLSAIIPQKGAPARSVPSSEAAPARPASPDMLRGPLPKGFGGSARDAKENIFFVEVEKVRPNPQQPRREFDDAALADLAESIQRHGIIQPLIVTKAEAQTSRGQEVWYELIAGERRLRAAVKAGLKHVPVIIRDAEEQQKLEVALVENLQRHDLSPLEEARAFRKLMDTFGLSQQEVALRVGKSRPAVANTMRLLDLPQEVQKGLAEGKITEGHARALLGLKDPVQILALYTETVEKALSVREVEDTVRLAAVSAGVRKVREPKNDDPEIREAQSRFAAALGTRVRLKGKLTKGKIILEYFSRDEFDRLAERIGAR